MYSEYHAISELKTTNAEGYLFRLEMFIYSNVDARILLSDKKGVDLNKDPAYEIGK